MELAILAPILSQSGYPILKIIHAEFVVQSEKYTPPSPDFAAIWDIGSDLSAHGFEGNVQSSYPPFIWPSTSEAQSGACFIAYLLTTDGIENYFEAMKSLGISMPLDAADGNAIGAYWAPQSLDPSSRTRSDSRTAYYNTSDTRPNLHLLTGHQVTKLLISSKPAGICATGVEVTQNLQLEDLRPLTLNLVCSHEQFL